FEAEEHQAAAVERRDRQEVEEREVRAERAEEAQELAGAEPRDARDLAHDADGAAELRLLLEHRHANEAAQRFADDEAGLRDRELRRLAEGDGNSVLAERRDQDLPFELVALRARRDAEVHRLAVALDGDVDLLAGVLADRLLELVPVGRRLAVDGEHAV